MRKSSNYQFIAALVFFVAFEGLAGPKTGGTSRPRDLDLPPRPQVTTPQRPASPVLRGNVQFRNGPNGAQFTSAEYTPFRTVRLEGSFSTPTEVSDFSLHIPRRSNPRNVGESWEEYLARADDPFQVEIINVDDYAMAIRQTGDRAVMGNGITVERSGQFRLHLNNEGPGRGKLVRTDMELTRRANGMDETWQARRSLSGRNLALYISENGAGNSRPFYNIEIPENVGNIQDYNIRVMGDAEYPRVEVTIWTMDGRELRYGYLARREPVSGGGTSFRPSRPIMTEPEMGRAPAGVVSRLTAEFRSTASVRPAQTVDPAGPSGTMDDLMDGGTN